MGLCWLLTSPPTFARMRVSPRAFFIGKAMILKPKNWDKFQHYSHRNPPWIKLHRDLLNDRIFASLPIASKAIAPLLWLLASESKDGSFDAASDELAFRLHIASKDIEQGLKPLIDNGFFVDASTMLAPCLQVATTERETEREGERETDKITLKRPDDISEELWKDFKKLRSNKKAPLTELVMKRLRNEADKAGIPLTKAIETMCDRGWAGFQADWFKKEMKEKPIVGWK
jgi:hypothetical protein